MSIRKDGSMWLAGIAMMTLAFAAPSSRESMAASIEDVAMMKGADRQKILVEGARK